MVDIVKAPFFPSQRFCLGFLAFLGNMFVYIVRVNLSVAIICMVRDDISNGTLKSHMYNSSSQSLLNESFTLLGDKQDEAVDDACGGGDLSDSSSSGGDRGEFDWDKTTRSELLTMYFYGYIFTQIPGGWLASRYGGHRVWGICMALSALCTLLTPVSARTHVYVAYALRFLLGFAAGVTFPCVHALLGRWSPPYERSKLAAMTFAGPLIGNVLTFSISGFLCEYGFDNGWGSIFYISAIGNAVWCSSWFLLAADSPEKHKRCSEREKKYIEVAIGDGNVKKVRKVPWLRMFTSGPVWAIVIAHVCNNYLNYTLMTSLPAYMKESLNFDIRTNGVLSSLPYVFQFISSVLAGYLADRMIERKTLTTRNVRRLFQCVSFLGSCVCIALVGQMGCETRWLAVVMLCACTFFLGANRSGYAVNHLDLAPSYAGILFGITNTVATIPGMVAPIIAGALTPNKSADEWQYVFYVCAAVCLLGAVFNFILVDGALQPWAVPPQLNQELGFSDVQSKSRVNTVFGETRQLQGSGSDSDEPKSI